MSGDELPRAESKEPFVVFVTGFGPFHNVRSNPTTTIAEKLIGYLKTWESSTSGSEASISLSAVTRTRVIETSAQAAHEAIDGIYSELRELHFARNVQESTSDCTQSAIVLHLGVNEKAFSFQLESCAYNEATFRLPDERGDQPTQEPIVHEVAFKAPLYTSVDVPTLVTLLNGDRTDTAVRTMESSDPGRYVCNFTYFLSLNRCQELRQSIPGAHVHCLFLHVPPFQIASENQQLELVGRLLRLLQQQVSPC